MWTPSRVTKAGGLGRGSNPLDSFFPFDPYLLRRSHVYIDQMYNTWKVRRGGSCTVRGETAADVVSGVAKECRCVQLVVLMCVDGFGFGCFRRVWEIPGWEVENFVSFDDLLLLASLKRSSETTAVPEHLKTQQLVNSEITFASVDRAGATTQNNRNVQHRTENPASTLQYTNTHSPKRGVEL